MQVLKQKTYSVTMTEEELRLFSEFLEERNFDETEEEKPQKSTVRKIGKGLALTGAGATAAGGAGMYLGYRGAKKIVKDGMKMSTEELAKRTAQVNKLAGGGMKLGLGGLAAGAIGSGLYLYGRHKDKKRAKMNK